jgi:hypothetical protein
VVLVFPEWHTLGWCVAPGIINKAAPLKQFSQADADWEIMIVASEDDVGKYTSLELEGSGYPHISYFDDTNNDLLYTYQDASGWHTEIADGFLYGHKDVAGWHDEIVTAISVEYIIGQYSSLALDDQDYPHISYFHNSDKELKYA